MADPSLVRRSPVPLAECNLARSFELVGDTWSLLLLRSALYGLRRFADFRNDLGIPRSVLSNRLAALVEAGLLAPRDYQDEGQRSRTEYHLTEMGRAIGLPFMAMTEWGDRWLGGGTGPFTLRSRTTGQRIRVAFVDEENRVVPASDIERVIARRRSKRTATGHK